MKLKDITGVIGEKLPVQPALMAKLKNVKVKLAAAIVAVTALIAAIAELM